VTVGAAPEVDAEIARTFRHEWGRVVSALVRAFGDIDVAEDAVQDAFVAAVRTWPARGRPDNPGAWITTTARHRAIDRLRREARRDVTHHEASVLLDRVDPHPEHGSDDSRLELVFTCCHPALEEHTQVALTLRLVAGLQVAEIARALLVPEPTLAQRLVRAKRKIRAAQVPYRVPDAEELPERLGQVLAVVYLVFNEGYLAATGDELTRADLCAEAIRLGRLLDQLMPTDAEVQGLLALMLLTQARHPARSGPSGSLVPLAEQDRSRWDRRLIEEGHALVRGCLRRGRPGPYQLQAAIAAVHTDARRAQDTDWHQVLALYDQHLDLAPTAVVALNRAVAVAEVHGKAVALREVEALDLGLYHLWHATRAHLLEGTGRHRDAAQAYRDAARLTSNGAERAHLEDRARHVGDASGPGRAG
jgi:RNA polymerase sigma-70 factor, ECF subfamily